MIIKRRWKRREVGEVSVKDERTRKRREGDDEGGGRGLRKRRR